MTELYALLKDKGVSYADSQELFKNGLTPDLFQKSQDLIEVKDLMDLHRQFGPQFLTILNALMAKMKGRQPEPPAPAKKDEERKPESQEEAPEKKKAKRGD